MWAADVRWPRQRAYKKLVVDDPARMGWYPFLSGPFVYRIDDRAYPSALELDKKLSQIAEVSLP